MTEQQKFQKVQDGFPDMDTAQQLRTVKLLDYITSKDKTLKKLFREFKRETADKNTPFFEFCEAMFDQSIYANQ